jgi:formylglycine-generating enzyme required for sulfatase activity
MKKSILLLGLLIAFSLGLFANNIQVSNLSIASQNYSQHYCQVKFDLSWENSWRNDSAPPFNWDAAWVFIKYKNLSGEWHHATLNNTGHSVPDSAMLQCPADCKGVFVYRRYDGHGYVSWTDVSLRWNYGSDLIPDDASLEISVFAIEMVYVPQGDFYIGDGNGSTQSSNAFYMTSDYYRPAKISDTYIRVNAEAGSQWDYFLHIGIDGDGGIDTTQDQTIDNSLYPTGYKAFYTMKYEMSQEQYRDFLNSLTRQQQKKRVWTNISGSSTDTVYVMSRTLEPSYYQSICTKPTFSYWEPIQFYCELNKVSANPPSFDPDSVDDGQTFACNYLSWMDAAAYADWAGLRPMTELEFEKACRGPNPSVTFEYAWGTPSIYPAMFTPYTFNHQNRGWSDEVITNPGVNTGNAGWSMSGSQLYRCGEFAASSPNHTKAEAGATYYGIMEMSGNLWEMVVHLLNRAGASFTGLHGNGELNSYGDADVDYWPGIGGNNNAGVRNTPYSGTGVTAAGGSGNRGGSMVNDQNLLRTSCRSLSGNVSFNEIHTFYVGFRAVRSAP